MEEEKEEVEVDPKMRRHRTAEENKSCFELMLKQLFQYDGHAVCLW